MTASQLVRIEGLYRDTPETMEWRTPDLADIATMRLDGLRILFADDSVDNRLLFERMLASAGASVQIVANGAEAVAAQSVTDFDAVILDICMPQIDGHAAARSMRRQGFQGPIIALTALARTGEEERCYESGFTAFYAKPIDRLSLLRAVRRAVALPG